ncbi:MAG TPA: branched-chain amino acid ABC transporter substrate-binding protein [Anaerolineales bacterium]|nr:branched-chain amino acid ABC transporter substrate-binding protein [Anaerolineales bacterium]
MSKRLFVLVSLVIATSMVLAACGGGGAASAKTLKIVSSLPMTGSSLTQTQTIVNAEELRLAQANNQACGGKYALSYEAWDDASAAQGQWDPAVETSNGNKAAADPSIIAYLGTFNSGAAKLSIPILDQAGPLVMISPANTYPGLTKPGYGPGEPDVYYPAGIRNYARVVTADDVQGKVDANFMSSQLGVKSVYILDDQQLYGKGVADVFEATAKSLGMTVLGHDGIDTKAADYKALMTKISTSNNGNPPDAIFVGMVIDSNATQLLKDKVAIMGDNTKVKFMGPDGIQTQAMIDGAGASVAEGIYASVAGLPFDKLTPAGQKFLTDYQAKYGKLTEPYAIYGYETMNVLLAAIESVCASGGDPSNRKAVRDAVFATKNFNGALGTWSFDANGDTSLTDMSIYQAQSGAYVAVGTFH